MRIEKIPGSEWKYADPSTSGFYLVTFVFREELFVSECFWNGETWHPKINEIIAYTELPDPASSVDKNKKQRKDENGLEPEERQEKKGKAQEQVL